MKEITTPLKSPLSGWRKPKPFADPVVKPPKPKYDDPLVHELLQYLRDKLGTELDGEFLPNYAACKELVRRCNAKGNDPKEVLTTLVDVSLQDPFHGPNTSSWRYLLNNAVKVFRNHAARFAKPQSRRDEAQRKADELFARQRAMRGHVD